MNTENMSERLKEIRGRLGAATPGPWEPMRAGLGTRVVSLEGEWEGIVPDEFITLVTPILKNSSDAEFIAHAPEDIRWLLEHQEINLDGIVGAIEQAVVWKCSHPATDEPSISWGCHECHQLAEGIADVLIPWIRGRS